MQPLSAFMLFTAVPVLAYVAGKWWPATPAPHSEVAYGNQLGAWVVVAALCGVAAVAWLAGIVWGVVALCALLVLAWASMNVRAASQRPLGRP